MKSMIQILFVISALSACNEPPTSVKAPPPVVIVLGEDISLSNQSRQRIGSEHLEALSKLVMQTGRRAVVVFGTIGDPTNAALDRLTLLPLPEPSPDATLSEQGKARQARERNSIENEKRIQAFVAEYKEAIKDTTEQTDLNGFLQKAQDLVSEDQFSQYQKYIFVNSDGQQSVGKNTKLVAYCQMPAGTTLFLSGWQQVELCNNAANNRPRKMESIEGFQSYLESILLSSKSLTSLGETP